MTGIDKCPICGGTLVHKTVEKLLRGGSDTAILNVEADVCLLCGERLYSMETVRQFEEIRRKLAQQETSGLRAVGKSYELA